MPPRKAPRVRVSLDAASSATPAPLSRAREAYNIVEIRQRVWRFLDKRSLARCMRVEKKGIYEVARVLYREIKYDQAMSMKRTTARQRIYSDAVLEINARYMSESNLGAGLRREALALARSFFRLSARRHLPHDGLTWFLNSYSAGLLNLILPVFRKSCPNLRLVAFEDIPCRSQYTVRFTDTPPIASPPSSLSSSSIVGHIDLLHHRDVYLDGNDIHIGKQEAPSPQYTLTERFDIYVEDEVRQSREETLRLIREQWMFDHLYKHVSFGSLPISLGDVVGLYERQIAQGYEQRLAEVNSENILPWDILDFQQLAGVALTSLIMLNLTNDLERDTLETNSRVTFADLPILIGTIRDHLPNLKVLAIAMSGVDEAESSCRSLLDSSCLDDGGSIKKLTIRTPTLINPLFNLLRVVSKICTSSVFIDISPEEGMQAMVQTEFLRRLRRQSADRRAHLSTLDFATIDVASYGDIIRLQYHDDGRPLRLAAVDALRWCGGAQASQEGIAYATVSKIPILTSNLNDFTEVAEHIKSMSGTANTGELLQEARRAREAAVAVADSSARAAGLMKDVAERSRQTVLELNRYVESLTKIVNGEVKEEAFM